MNPIEFAKITKETLDAFEAWYAEHGANGDKDTLFEAYSAASAAMLARAGRWLNDRLYSSPEEAEEIPDGAALEAYLEKAVQRLAYEYAEDLVHEPLSQAMKAHGDLAMKQIFTILESYSGKKLNGYDDDDGIEGAEAEARHAVFDNTLAAIGFVKEKTLKKDAVVRTFRALADFYEREL